MVCSLSWICSTICFWKLDKHLPNLRTKPWERDCWLEKDKINEYFIVSCKHSYTPYTKWLPIHNFTIQQLSKGRNHHGWLTLWGRVKHICISKLSHPWFRFNAKPLPVPRLTFCVNWTAGKTLQWTINWNPYNIIAELHLKMLSANEGISSWPQCVNT